MAATTFADILKFNPYHDAKGRFASANGYATFTYAPGKSKAHDLAIQREKERTSKEPYINGLQLQNAMLDSHKADFNNLSKEEQNAIKRYMSSTGISDSYKNKGLVDQAISRSELPVNATLTRGVKDLPTTMEEAKSMIGQSIGTTTPGKPISTSIKPDQNWGTSTIVIQADKGTKGMYVEAARQSKKADQARARYAKEGRVAGEAEFLLPSTTKIKITGVRMGSHNGQDKIIYDAVIDNQVGKSAGDSFSIFKTDDDKRLVFGWASISITVDGEQLEDRQKDIIDPEDLEEAAYEYVLNFRDTGEEHVSTMRKKGKLVESCVFTAEKQKAIGIPEGILPIGWWIGFKIEDDAAWERVKNGTYRMFSIEGKANRIPVEKSQLIGCGVLVVQGGKILSGTRIERGGRGKICGPGGHIEDGETPEEAAKREAMEEFGITCQELTPLGTLKDGSSAIFLCQKFTGNPETDEEEMTDVEWRTIEELHDAELFRPFEESLALLKKSPAKRPNVAKTFSEILKFNPYHDAKGRFTSGEGGSVASFTYAPGKSKAHDLAIQREKERQAAGGSAKPAATGTTKEDIDNLAAETAKNMSDYADKAYLKSLTNAEGEAIEAYVEEIGFEMNKVARGKPIDEEYYEFDEVLDHALNFESALSKASLPKDAAVFRGSSFDTAVDSTGLRKKEIQADPQKLVGKTITEMGFMSTTTDAGMAEEYAAGMVYHIKLPAGSQAFLQNSLNPYLDGPEFTVNRNSNFKVIAAENRGGNTHVYMEYTHTGNNTQKSAPVAKSFDQILKLNPFHDALGRFATKNGFKTYSANPNTRAGAMAIARSAAAGHGDTMNVHPESYGETISQNADWLGQNNYNVGPGQTGAGVLTQEVEPKNGLAGASAHGYVWQYYNRLDNRTTGQAQAKHSELADHVKNVQLKDSDKLAMSQRDPYGKAVKGKIIAKNNDQKRVAGKDISDSVDLSNSKSKKAAIDQIAKLQGWNKDPTVTEDLEVFQKAAKQSGQMLVRTVHMDYSTGKSAIDVCKDAMGNGNAALGGGGAKAYGGGMYMVGTKVTGATGRKLKEKVASAQNDSYGYGDTQMMATVRPSAKIATHTQSQQMRDDFRSMTSENRAKYGKDYGAYIAAKGFDGAQWHEGDNAYITMYNKSAMIFYAGVVPN